MKQRIRWLALHGFVRGVSSRRPPRRSAGPADRRPAGAGRPRGIRRRDERPGPDHEGRADLHDRRSQDRQRAVALRRFPRLRARRRTCPSRCNGSSTAPRPDLLHPLEPPSMLSVEPPDHTRYRKLVSSVFTTRAVAALRDRVQDTANPLLDDLADEPAPSTSWSGTARSFPSP